MMYKIGEVFTLIRNGANIKQGEDDTGYPITRIETISNRVVDRNKMGHAGIHEIDRYSDYVLQDGDILMSHINSEAHLGKVALYEKMPDETIIHGMNLLCLRSNRQIIDCRYAFYFLLSDSFLRQIPRITKKSVNQASFNVAALKELQIHVPPMEQQLQIVGVMDKIQKVLLQRQEQSAAMDQLVKSRFVELFGDVQHEEKYKGIQLRELCTTVSGGTPSTKFPDYYEGDIPWISTVSLGPNHIDGSTAKGYITQEAIDNSATKLIPAGNILFGTRVGVGKSSLNDVDICTNQDIVAIMGINESRFKRLFIKHVLDAYQPYYDSIKKGATILGITGDDLKDTLIPDAPIEIQMEYETFVEQVDKSKVVVQNALKKAEILFDSLMQTYFG